MTAYILEIICWMTILFGILVQYYPKISYWMWVSVTLPTFPFDYINTESLFQEWILFDLSVQYLPKITVTYISQSFDFVYNLKII